MTNVADAYSRRAVEYSDLLGSMEAVHPSDRQLVDCWADGVTGRVVDAGCGPGHWGDILSWYSTIHHAPARIAVPIAEFARTLRPGGTLVLGHFAGSSIEAFDHAVARAFRWPASALQAILESNGFDVVETHSRTGPSHRPHGAIVCRRRIASS